jgi:hypothetical protein
VHICHNALLYPALTAARVLREGTATRGYLGTGAPEKETILAKNSKDVMDRAEASFKKEERAREGAKAMRDYEAESRAVREKTARLKALRLAKEATEKDPPAKVAEPKKAGRQPKATPSA